MARRRSDWSSRIPGLGRLIATFAQWRTRSAVIGNPSLSSRTIGILDRRDFERLVTMGLHSRGFEIGERLTYASSVDVDFILDKQAKRFLLQFKHWQTPQVTLRMIHEAHGDVVGKGLDGGFLVTTGACSEHSRRFAAHRNIHVVDGGDLEALLKAGRSRVAALIFEGAAANGPEFFPYCPACKTPMVVRSAKRGAHSGSSAFWVCAQSSTCRQTMVMWSEGRRSA